jgi:hypothetical protein
MLFDVHRNVARSILKYEEWDARFTKALNLFIVKTKLRMTELTGQAMWTECSPISCQDKQRTERVQLQ